jgi:hypothetical protein
MKADSAPQDLYTTAWQDINPTSPIDEELRTLFLMYYNRCKSARYEGSRGGAGWQVVSSKVIGFSIPPPQRIARRSHTKAVVPPGASKALQTPTYGRMCLQNEPNKSYQLTFDDEMDLTFEAVNGQK